MGRQIRFYLNLEEEFELLKYIKSLGFYLVKYLNYKESKIELLKLNDIEELNALETRPFIVITNKPELLTMNYFADANKFAVDRSTDIGFVDFRRSYSNEDKVQISLGRIYYETYRYDKLGIKQRINSEYDELYKTLSKKIKEMCIKVDDFYIGKKSYESISSKKYRFIG